jgi:hypothetical protein
MQPLTIILVAGLAGAGKTTWIRQQIEHRARSVAYLSLGSQSAPIDATYLAAEFPHLTVLSDEQLVEFLAGSNHDKDLYIELGFQIDLASLVLPQVSIEQHSNASPKCHRVAVLPSGVDSTDWDHWATQIVPGMGSPMTLQSPHLWRSLLTGQVFDPASLNTFWYELTHGAYGKVQRTKGIFEIIDGRSFYFDFAIGLPDSVYAEMPLPRWLEGRPDRLSGIEILGENLEPTAIVQTLKDCCLEDSAIAYYQQQLQSSSNPTDLPG